MDGLRTRGLTRLKPLLGIVALIATILSLVVASAARATTTLCVNSSDANCFHTIQAAIDAAASGDTITVVAGPYNEQISVNKPLTLKGARVGVDARTRNGAESVLGSVSIGASDVVVDGFSFNGTGSQVSVSSPTTLSGIVVQNDIFAGYSSVALATYDARNILVQRNHFASPLGSGEAIQIKASAVQGGCNGSSVLDNVFSAATNNGGADVNLSCTGSNSVGVTVSGNTSTGNSGGSSFAAFSGVLGGISVTGNTATTTGSPIFFFGSVSGSAVVDGNTLASGGSAKAVSIHGADSLGTNDTANTGTFTITNNHLAGNDRGIFVAASALGVAAQVAAHGNDLSGNTAGLENASSVAVDATGNYWGSSTGPENAGNVTYNSSIARGAEVIGAAAFVPWLDSPTGSTIAPATTSNPAGSFASIQAAVNASNAGATITAAAGNHAESVLIDKSLTIVGVGAATVISGHAPDNYIVKVNGANGVILDTLAIDGGGSAAGDNGFSSGILVNGSGTSGSPVEIKNSTIRNLWNISAAGLLVTDSGGTPSYAVISGNTISSFHKHGIRFVRSDGHVFGTEIIGDNVDGTGRVQNLITLWGGSNVEINNSTLRNALTTPGGTPTWDSPAVLVTGFNSDGTVAASHANVHDNQIYNDDTGVVVGSAYTGNTTDGTDHSSAVIANNNMHDLNTGINFEQTSASATITGDAFSSISGYTLDAESFSTLLPTSPTVTATNNWWGQLNGPAIGQIASSVTASTKPWCTDSACSTMSNNASLASLSFSSGTLSPAFSSSTTSYSVSVDNSVTSVTVSKTSSPGATASVSGGSNLAVGANTVTVAVTSADGSVAKAYTVTVNRASAPPSGGGGETPAPTTTTTTTPPAPVPNETKSAPATPAQSGTVSVVVAPIVAAGSVAPAAASVAVAVSWPAGTFTTPVAVTVKPQPPAAPPAGGGPAPAPASVAGGFTTGTTTIQLTVTDTAGNAVTAFAAPIMLHISAGEAGDVPAYSHDGTAWTTIPRLFSLPLPADQQDGYFVNPDGSVDIYTRHATYFGLLKDTQAPSVAKLRGQLAGRTLRLTWSGSQDNVRVTGYRIMLGGKTIKTTARTHVVLPIRLGRYAVVTIDAAGNRSHSSASVQVVRTKNKQRPFRIGG